MFCALDEGDEDAAGDVFAGLFIGGDGEAVDADAFADGVEVIGCRRAGRGD